MLHGVNFNAKKFAHIVVTPISPSWNTFFIHTSSYKNAHFWGAPPYLKDHSKVRMKDIVRQCISEEFILFAPSVDVLATSSFSLHLLHEQEQSARLTRTRKCLLDQFKKILSTELLFDHSTTIAE
jgi:hypothetical protein